MLAQRPRRWAYISPALGQHLMFDRLHDRKHWTEMNGTLTDTDSTGRTQLKQHAPPPPYVYRGERNNNYDNFVQN